jgi:hypothetical protein
VLSVQRDGETYEVHPPGHVRAAFVCRLLARMGYGALADGMEQRWRAQHGSPDCVYVPTIGKPWLALDDEAVIARALDVGESLYQDGYAALSNIPLRSIPGFDFGPREHQAALAVKSALLGAAPGRVPVKDARLLIAGAVLAWAEAPGEAVRLLRAARRDVGNLPLRVAGGPRSISAPEGELTPELVRDAVLLDILLTPPSVSRLRR